MDSPTDHPEAPDTALVATLRCPTTGQRLGKATAATLERLRELQEAGELRDRAGNTVAGTVAAGLVREDGTRFFPVRDGIPVLLEDEAIDISA